MSCLSVTSGPLRPLSSTETHRLAHFLPHTLKPVTVAKSYKKLGTKLKGASPDLCPSLPLAAVVCATYISMISADLSAHYPENPAGRQLDG